MAIVRALLCIPDAGLDARMRAMLSVSNEFEIADTATLENFVEKVSSVGPDVVVIESEALDEHLQDRLTQAGQGRPVPSVVLIPAGVTPDRAMRQWLQQARCNTISASLVARDDGAARKHVVDRLSSVAYRLRAGNRRTLSDDDIEDAMDAVISAAGRAEIPRDVSRLAAWPVDLVLLTGSSEAESFLLETFSELYATSVPIAICLRGSEPAELVRRLSAVSRVPVTGLEGWKSIRGIRGAIVAPARGITLSGEKLTQGQASDSGTYASSLLSLSGLSSGLTVVMLSDSRTELADQVATLRTRGANLAVAGHDGDAQSRAAEHLADTSNVAARLNASTLTWYLAHAIPRRE